MLVVKRYPNRKLYDTQARRYVTLDEIGDLVQSGEEVQVVDHRTGDDLTDITLTQVIVTRARRQATILPRSVLSHLIRSGASPSGGWRQQIERCIATLQGEGELSAEGAEQLRDLLGRSASQAFPLPAAVERRVEATLRRMNLPTRADVLLLRSQLDDLARQLEDHEQQAVEPAERV